MCTLALPTNFTATKLELNKPVKGTVVFTSGDTPDVKAAVERLDYMVQFHRVDCFVFNIAGRICKWTVQAHDMHKDELGLYWYKSGDWLFVPGMQPRTDAERIEQVSRTYRL